MPDREKVINGLECLAQKQEPMANPCSKCDYHDRPNFAFCVVDVATDALALLKEQEAKIEQLNRFVNGFSRDAMPVVRCKDCKHRPKEPNWKTYECGLDIEFPEGSKCPCKCSDDEYYSWYPEDDWFCAVGERKVT